MQTGTFDETDWKRRLDVFLREDIMSMRVRGGRSERGTLQQVACSRERVRNCDVECSMVDSRLCVQCRLVRQREQLEV